MKIQDCLLKFEYGNGMFLMACCGHFGEKQVTSQNQTIMRAEEKVAIATSNHPTTLTPREETNLAESDSMQDRNVIKFGNSTYDL